MSDHENRSRSAHPRPILELLENGGAFYEARLDGRKLHLSNRLAWVLLLLAAQVEVPVPRERLREPGISDEYLDHLISRLRRELGREHIRTVGGPSSRRGAHTVNSGYALTGVEVRRVRRLPA